MPLFQALHVHCPALNGMVFHDLTRPFAELHGTLIIGLEADGNDGLQVIVLGVVSFSIRGSYSVFLNN